jgi:hypothetical protein
VSKIISTKHLRLAIAVIIAITGLRMWYQREMFHGKIQP